MNNTSGLNVDVYINHGAGSKSDFTFQIQQSWGNANYFSVLSAVFSAAGADVNSLTPNAVKPGAFQFDGRYLKVKVSNNSTGA